MDYAHPGTIEEYRDMDGNTVKINLLYLAGVKLPGAGEHGCRIVLLLSGVKLPDLLQFNEHFLLKL